MFEASVKARQFSRGQSVEGTVVAIGPKVAFVNIGGKGEAEIDVAELKDADGDIDVSVGDRIQAMVVSTSGGIVLSRKGVRNAATQRELEDAFQAGLAVEGKVAQSVKGGYEVRIARERAFCPLSQIDIVRTDDPEVHVGRTYAFRVIEYKNGGKDVVLSRRKHLEEEQRASAADVRKSIVPGAVLAGRVVSVPEFGAFVDLGGGIQGLLHVSEMSWSRGTKPAEIVTPGDQITVKVLRVDEATQKISLGLKQLLDDPWTALAATFEVGQVRTGRVTRMAEFGAFVELGPRHRRVGARLDVRANGSRGRMGKIGGRGLHRRVRNPDDRHRAETHRPRTRGRRNVAGRRSHLTTGRVRARRDREGQGRASREIRRVRVPGAGAHRLDAVLGNRRRSRHGHVESLSDRQRSRSGGARSRSCRPPHSPQQEGGCGAARAGGAARLRGESRCRPRGLRGIAGRSTAQCPEGPVSPGPLPTSRLLVRRGGSFRPARQAGLKSRLYVLTITGVCETAPIAVLT